MNGVCIYEDNNGICTLWDKTCKGRNYDNDEMGWGKEDDGGCAVSGDPNPYNNCTSFEPNDPEFEPEQEY